MRYVELRNFVPLWKYQYLIILFFYFFHASKQSQQGGPSMMPFAPTHMNPRMLNQLMANQRFAASMAQAAGSPHGPHHRGAPPGASSMGMRFPGSFYM